MKGIIFTLDSIFALIIAVASISVLLYFYYYSQNQPITRYSEASSILQTLLTSNLSTINSANPLVAQIAYQANATNETWDEYQKNNSDWNSNTHGPLFPTLSFVFNSVSNANNGMIADYGKLYVPAGGTLYAINATSANVVWKASVGNTFAGSPLIFQGMLLYSNYTSMNALDPNTGSIIWTNNALERKGFNVIASPLYAYGQQVLQEVVASGTHGIAAFWANNGTFAWNAYVPGTVRSVGIVQGNPEFETLSTNGIGTLITTSTLANIISYNAFSTSVLSGLVTFGSDIAYGQGFYANVITPDDNAISSSFPLSIISTVTGVAYFNGTLVYQTSNSVVAILPNGLELWSAAQPTSVLGTAPNNATPIVSGGHIYTVWSNGYLLAQNLSNGKMLWETKTPSGAFNTVMALAYGKLFVSASNGQVYSFGACAPTGSGSLLSIAASLYVSGKGSCADALLDSAFPMVNYSIYINNTFAPGMNIASFNSLNYSSIYLGNNASIETNGYSWSAWFNSSGWSANAGIISSQGCGAATNCPEIVETSNATAPYRLEFTTQAGTAASTVYANSVSNIWQNVVGTYNATNGTTIIYLNGARISSSNTIVSTRTSKILYIGAANLPHGGVAPEEYYNGLIADVQIYNTTLSDSQITQLYFTGIQGPGISNAGLSAWYPLDGDANDYASFTNTGYAQNGIAYIPANYVPIALRNSFEVNKASTLVSLNNYTSGTPRTYSVSVVSWK